MDPLTTLLNWLAPVLDPLADFRKQVEKLTGIHQSSVHTFSALAGSLINAPTGPNAFTGKLASSFWEDAQAYLNAENALMGGGTTVGLAGESGVEEAALACEECVAEITADAGVAATEIAGDAVLDEVTGIVDVAAVAEGGANPIADVAGIILTLVAGAVLLVSLTKLAWDIYNNIQQWQRSMYRAGDTPLPQLPPNPQPVATPTPSSGPSNSLSPAQQRLFNDVKSRLGTTSYNDAEIEALIRAGYLDPDAIAAIIKGGSYAVFSNPSDAANIATLMKELTPAQQQQFIAIVEQYQKTHPGLTSHQIYNYLRYARMKVQAEQFVQDIQNSVIAHQYPTATQRLLDRFYQNAINSMRNVTDPFSISDNKLGLDGGGGGWYSHLVGITGEWGTIQYYYHESLTNHNVILKDFSVPIANSETDIILEENGVVKWVEVKNILNLRRRTGSWKNLGDQIDIMVDNGARNIVIDLPQGITNNMKQELINRGAARHVSVEVRTPSGIPYEPPVPPNWGNSLPNP